MYVVIYPVYINHKGLVKQNMKCHFSGRKGVKAFGRDKVSASPQHIAHRRAGLSSKLELPQVESGEVLLGCLWQTLKNHDGWTLPELTNVPNPFHYFRRHNPFCPDFCWYYPFDLNAHWPPAPTRNSSQLNFTFWGEDQHLSIRDNAPRSKSCCRRGGVYANWDLVREWLEKKGFGRLTL